MTLPGLPVHHAGVQIGVVAQLPARDRARRRRSRPAPVIEEIAVAQGQDLGLDMHVVPTTSERQASERNQRECEQPDRDIAELRNCGIAELRVTLLNSAILQFGNSAIACARPMWSSP